MQFEKQSEISHLVQSGNFIIDNHDHDHNGFSNTVQVLPGNRDFNSTAVEANLIYMLCPNYQLAPFINGAAPTIS